MCLLLLCIATAAASPPVFSARRHFCSGASHAHTHALAPSLPARLLLCFRWCSLIANGVFHNKTLSLEAHDANNIRHVVAQPPAFAPSVVWQCLLLRLSGINCALLAVGFQHTINPPQFKVYNASIVLRSCNEVCARRQAIFCDCPSRWCHRVSATDQKLHVHVEALRCRSGEPSIIQNTCPLHPCESIVRACVRA